jgi:RNA polymerase sigma-70 factor, ECF subfamily
VDDTELISRACSHDATVWELLVRRYSDRLYRVATLRIGNEEDAQDAVQEVWIRAWRWISRYRSEADFYTWLYAICRNVCGDILRRHQLTVVPLPEVMDVPAHSLAVDEQVIINVKLAALRRAVAGMDSELREALLLHLDGLSSREIGRMLEVEASSTIRSRVDRARKLLALALLSEGER